MPSPYYPAAAITLVIVWEDHAWGATYGTTAQARPSTTVVVRPKSLLVANNGIRMADTVRFVLDAREFPFDPRTVRSVEVTASIGVREPGKEFRPTSRDYLFVGFVDTFVRSHGSDGEEIEFNGRDYTSVLLDTPYPYPNAKLGAALVPTLKAMLAEVPAAKILLDHIVIDPLIDDVLVGGKSKEQREENLGQAAVSAAGLRQGANGEWMEEPRGIQTKTLAGQVTQGGAPLSYSNNYWDVMQELVDPTGLILFVRKTELHLAQSRTLSTERQVNRAPLFKWGRNLESLKIVKRVGRLHSPNILATSYVPGQKEPLRAHWPETLLLSNVNPPPRGALAYPTTEKLDPTGAPPSLSAADLVLLEQNGKLLPFHVKGVTSQAMLKEVAHRIWDEYATNEIEMSVTTRDMDVIPLDEGAAVSLLQIHEGDPINILPHADDLTRLGSIKDTAARVSALVVAGYDRKVAQALVSVWSTLDQYGNTMRCRSARHEFSVDTGYRLSIEAGNYINAALPKGVTQ